MKRLAFCAALSVCFVSAAANARVWEQIQGARRSPLPKAPASAPGFTRLDPAQSGVRFTNVLLESLKIANINLMNGSGVALGDYDGDGLCDVYLCDLNGMNRMFKNLGDWHFRDATDESGTACPRQTSTGAVFADVNGDGRLDLLVTSMGGPHACFLNLGGGRFTNMTARAGISSRLGATSLALADIDGNGTLDLYIANYGVTSILRSGGALNVSYENGRPVVRGRYAQRVKIINNQMWEQGEPDALYLNDGAGKFKAVSWTNGAFRWSNGSALAPSEVPWDQGLTVAFRDIDGDGAPDIYVCNDAFTPDRLWLNDGKGNFRALNDLKLRTTSHFSMGVDFADIDRNGTTELFVADMLSRKHILAATQKGNMPPQPYVPGDYATQWQMRRNTLLRSDGAGGFSDIAFYAGVAGSEWSWCPIFIDVDLDGWEDLIISNGFEHNTDDMDAQEKARSQSRTVEESRRLLTALYPALETPNAAFHNRRDLTFDEVGRKWGFDALEVCNGMALGDLDNDGDMDVVVNCLNAPAIVYRNNASARRIAVCLKGRAPNTAGIGARITVEGGPVAQTQEMAAGGRYFSGDEPMRVFAAGASSSLRITVKWRDESVSVLENAAPGYAYEIDQSAASAPTARVQSAAPPLFTDVSFGQKHKTDGFDDFAAQASLPFHLDAFGPGVIFTDMDGDGKDDILTGCGRAGGGGLALNDGKGGFIPAGGMVKTAAAAGLICWPKSESERELLVSFENYGRAGSNNIGVFNLRAGAPPAASAQSVFQSQGVGGPLALTELDGDMTLFWGARFVAGHYPEAAPSHLYRCKNGQWTLDSRNEALLSSLGLVNSAVWSDLDGNGSPELIVACSWGPVKIFSSEDGILHERTGPLGLGDQTGLWLGVVTGDFDGDGRMDIAAGNWGLNSFYNQAADRAVSLYYGEFNAPGNTGMFEACFDSELKKMVPWRDKRVLAASMPWLNEQFPTHAQFAQASMDEILSRRPVKSRSLRAASLASTIFLNRGDHFEPRRLPAEAQFAPAFGVAAADFDNDGKIDLFFAQNFFAVREFDSRLDAGRGLLLKGRGDGSFAALSPAESGILIYGEQRGCASGDYNHDGRTDLLVAQYAGDTKLLANRTAPEGIRVRLKGGANNLAAAGAQFQIGDGEQWGPLHEVQIGSGYWSQSSLTKVLAPPKTGAKLRVRWPGGKTWSEAALPEGKNFEVSRQGDSLVIRSN